VLRERYLTRKGDDVVETPEEMCWRVAQSIAAGEARYGRSPAAVQEVATAFYEMMVEGYFLPNSPTLMNAGKNNGLQYSACYVLPVGDSMEEIFDAVKDAAIIHKCLVADTFVMSNGLTRLSEVRDGAVVMTDEGPFHVSALHDNGEQPVYEVRTNRGYQIAGTAEHRVLVVADDGSHRWRRIGEMRPGDWLVMKPGAWVGGDTKLREFTFRQRPGGNATSFKARECRLPRELTPELGELIGLYIGDGSNHRDGIRFSVGADSPEVIRRIEELSITLFGKAPTVYPCSGARAFEVSILSTQVKEWFAFHGITKTSSREARIPEIILRGTEEIACAFVRGLFTADGCVRKNGHLTLTTSSRALGEKLQIMLLALGVPTQLRHDIAASGFESYQLSPCTKAGFRAFREKIGFIVGKKAARLAAVSDSKIFVKGETIPNQRKRVRAWYKALSGGSKGGVKSHFDGLVNRVTSPRQLSRQGLINIMKKSAAFPPFFEELAAQEFFFVRVVEVRSAGVRRVYDLTVPEKHAYLANGFVSHNSGGGTGFAFSRLRPKDDVVASTGGRASGPVSFLRVFNAATEAVKQGGCVTPETRVSTDRGIVEIRALGPASASPETWHKHEGLLRVATDEGPRESDEFYVHGVTPVRRIRTHHGYTVCATLEHRLRVISEEGQYVWKAIEDIQVGDWVALQKRTYLPVENFKFPAFEFRPHPNATPVRRPETPTEELGEFIGYFLGDGAVSVNARGTGRLILSVCQQEPDVASHLIEIANRIFGLRPVRQAKAGDDSENYFFNSTTLVAWLKAIGVEKPSALDVQLPELAFRAGPTFARGLVRGLFTADGTASEDGYPSLSSASKALVEGMQQLLLSLGVPSRFSVTTKRIGSFGHNPVYRLRVITHAGLRVFADEIGFFSSEKQSRLRVGRAKAWEFNDIVPFQGALLRALYGGPGRGSGPGRSPRGANRKLYRALQHYLPGVTTPRHLTRSRLEKLVEAHPRLGDHPTVAWLLTNDQFYDQVDKIEEGESLTLDLSIPANSTYIANGFVSHNTRRGANMGILKVDHPDILEFIECKLDGGITNFNISVAATDGFMDALYRGEEYELINPHTKQVVTRLSAREVFDRIVRAAWRTGDPGMVFIDRINASPANPTPEIGMIEATNPCVTGDTLVATPTGWRQASTIRPGDLVETVNGPRPVERVEVYETTPVFRVLFSDGGALRATAGHQFYVRREDRGLAPIRLDRCRPGDAVQTFREGLSGSAKILSIEPAGIETTYDLYERETDTWITEGYVSRGCGEQPLLGNEACNLGSLNVSKFTRPAADGTWTIDWEEMERIIRLSVRFLDDVIEMNPYPLPVIDATVKANRRIGLGIMGWADLLFIMGIPYGSEEAIDLAAQLMVFAKEKAHDQSARLAEERGPFPNWSRSIYKQGRPMRNSTVTTIAPTGTISMIAGCSSGIEPIFALAFEHRVKQGDRERVLTFVNETFEAIARRDGFYSEALMQEIARRGTLHDIPGLPPKAAEVFKTAHEIPYEWHVRHQAAFQRYTDNGVSKTINLPNAATEEDVASAYRLAWELGCLGITVFRDGCKGEQVLNVGVTAKKEKEALAAIPASTKSQAVIKPRPHSLTGATYRMETPIGTAFITVNETEDKEPFEVFVQVGKGGSDTMAVAEALGRLISLVLRLPSPFSARRRLEEIISQLSRIGGGQPTGFGPSKVLSLPDALARTLAEHIGQIKAAGAAPVADGTGKRIGDLCKECGQATFIYEEGCKKCLSCGFNEC
jgi:ribonucleotide reductase alpha subunit